jgi:ubiquinone/menaquinone biosynthesis C-methylase UbiE
MRKRLDQTARTIGSQWRIHQHYLLERKLAQRILESPRADRTRVTIEAYDELFSSIPWHSQLQETAETRQRRLEEKRLFFGYLVSSHSDVLDIGTGTGYWIRYLAAQSTARCVGIDVSSQVLARRPDDPPNLEFYIMGATELDFPAGSFDVAFSSQLIEHLHPDDVGLHLTSVWRVLRENGTYALDTPSVLTGPHDISRYFDETGTGFHLKEWTFRELASLLRQAGFRRIRTMVLPWSLVARIPFLRIWGMVPVDLVIPGEVLAAKVRHRELRSILCKLFRLYNIYIIARK